jgi:hypothetical protein
MQWTPERRTVRKKSPRAALRTASTFAERRGRADWDAFDRLMTRQGDEMPEEERR